MSAGYGDAWDLQAAKSALIELLTDTPGLQQVFDGAPESMPTYAAAWVTIGPLVEPARSVATSGIYDLRVDLLVTIGFIVGGIEATAEESVALAVVEISRRVLLNRLHTVGSVTPMLNGTVKTISPPGPAVGNADYVSIAGQEARVYPMSIEITQRESIN